MTLRRPARLVVLIAVALLAVGCGRRGALDLPASAPAAEDPAAPRTADAVTAEPAAPDRPFILDPLI